MKNLLLILALIPFVSGERKLEFVQALWRHGDRAPLNLPYPNDRYTEKDWVRGWGQLTSIGMNQLHELGEYFKNEYIVKKQFVSANFSTKEVYIRSSDSDRALVSAQSFTYGMYPASAGYQWSGQLDWQPIPIHATTPGEPDLICKPTAIDCKKHDDLVEADDEILKAQYDKQYADLFAELSGNSTGIQNATYENVNGFYDVQRELIHNLTAKQPSWVFKNWTQYANRNTLDIITEMRTTRMLNQFNSDQKSKLSGGALLNTWIQNALAVSANNTNQRMMLYSSHDGVLLALLHAMGAGNGMMVPYASALIMHVYSDNDKHFLELYYRNETTHDAYLMPLPRCSYPCEVQQFATNYENMTVKDYGQLMELCGTPLQLCSFTSSTNFSIIFLILSIKFLVDSMF